MMLVELLTLNMHIQEILILALNTNVQMEENGIQILIIG